jgi:hypothetical protein
MVFAAIWISDRSDLIIMERDPDALRGGYTTKLYLDTLKGGLLLFYDPEYIFQQDNAGIHRSEAAELWFETYGIHVIE